MKKLIAMLLALTMMAVMFVGCSEEPAVETESGLATAKEYLYTMYKDASGNDMYDYIQTSS